MKWVVILGTVIGAAGANAALAQPSDRDGDGVPDASDVFPDDASAASEVHDPGRGAFTTYQFEDQWPDETDHDFNDVVVLYNHALRARGDGAATAMIITAEVVAVGGDLDHALAIHLPGVAPGAIQSAVLADGTFASPWPGEPDAVLTITPSLRAVLGGQQGPINADPNRPRQTSARLEIEVFFSASASVLPPSDIDVFIHRVQDRTHQVHQPRFAGTASMNTTLFGTGIDASTTGRWFVDGRGVPFTLAIPTARPYPTEGLDIALLYPEILTFASSGGTQSADFYDRPQTAFAFGGGLPGVAPGRTHGGTVLVRLPADPTLTCTTPSNRAATLAFDVPAGTTTYTLSLYAADGQGMTPLWINRPDGSRIELGANQPMHFQLFDRSASTVTGAAEVTITVPGLQNLVADVQTGQHDVQLTTDSRRVCGLVRPSAGLGDELDLNVYVGPVADSTLALTPANAASHAGWQQLIGELASVLAAADIRLGNVRYVDAADRPASVASLDAFGDLLQTSRTWPSSVENQSIDVFLVSEVWTGGAGRAGDIPGPPTHGTTRSGVALALRSPLALRDGVDTNNIQLGRVLAHELFHYLGLFHYDEHHRTNGECGLADCAFDNLMRDGTQPNSFVYGTELTPAQIRHARQHPLLRRNQASSCEDGVLNGSETGLDCGGPSCAPCNCHETTTPSRRYIVCPGTYTWDQARASCQSFGADLVSIRGPVENNIVDAAFTSARLATDPPPIAEAAGWVGGTDRDAEGTWLWADASPSTYSDWAPYEPNNGRGSVEEDCLTFCAIRGLSEQHCGARGWGDSRCDTTYRQYMCAR